MAFIGPRIVISPVANNMTGVVALTSQVIDMRTMSQSSVQLQWTGTPTGTFSVQSSLDYSASPQGNILNAGTWTDIGISVTSPSGSAGGAIVDMSLTGLPYLRMVYTNVSGTGTLQALIFAKG